MSERVAKTIGGRIRRKSENERVIAMAIKKSQLYSMLWEGCDALRGGMDASLYKDYVLVMLFLKYISDKKKAGDADMMEDLPDDCTFDEIRKLKHKNDIGEQINVKLAKNAEIRVVFKSFTLD